MFESNLEFSMPAEESVSFKIELDERETFIHENAVTRARKYLGAEAELLSAIVEVDKNKVYEKFGLTHLTPYCVRYLGLSEDIAGHFVRVARKSIQVPELKCAIDDGRLTVSKAKAVAAVITPANQLEWIGKATTLSRDKLEREVAKVSPYSPKAERAKPVGADKFLVSFELSLEEMKAFRRAQEIVSQKLKSAATQRATVVDLVKCFLKHNDPVEKAERVIAKRSRSFQQAQRAQSIQKSHQPQFNSEIPESMRHPPRGVREDSKLRQGAKRKAISAAVRHAVFARDNGECQARMPTGEKCSQRRWIDLHHKKRRSMGGSDTVENLVTLCSKHHRMLHAHEES